MAKEKSKTFDPKRSFSDVLGTSAVQDLVATSINTAALTRATDGYTSQEPIEVRTNKEFWTKVRMGDLGYPEPVLLKDFFISEWVPASPGRYYTSDAASARRRAADWSTADNKEFLPEGKLWMVLGGIGNVRLAPRHVRGSDAMWFGATSDGVCHRGIPLVCPISLAEKLRPKLHRSGGQIANITGHLWSIWDTDLPIKFHTDMPRVVVFCDKIQVAAEAKEKQLRATASIMFDVRNQSKRHYGRSADGPYRKGWSFVSFDPVGGKRALDQAVIWLKDYMERYGYKPRGQNHPSIFSDFDELTSHFDDEPEFPLPDIMSRRLNKSLFYSYASKLNLTIQGDFVMGDSTKYEVSGGQVAAFGERASARDVTQNMVVTGAAGDLQSLIAELATLRNHLVNQARDAGDYVQVGAIAEAEQAAKAGDQGAVLKALSKTGKWALDAATAIGTSVAAGAIKAGLGL